MSSLVIRSAVLSCVALAGLSACNRGDNQTAMLATEPAELTWARSALERNPRYEVLASDVQTRVFTVRDRTTGQIQTINLNELAAAPISQLKSQPAVAATAPVEPPAPPAPTVAATAPPQPTAPTTTTPAEVVDNSPAAAAERAQASSENYTIDRTGGQLRVTGRGVSIVSSGKGNAADSQNIAGVRPSDPIICEGKRMLKLDDRNIYVDGDAIIARGGCELYITNSHIVASGTGLIVEDAVVHVANSHIEGSNGSFNATDRAKMYVRTSTFQGVPRRAEFASVLDQGGNQYR